MKIVDVSITCAEYEKELLYLKLILESPTIDEFVLVENRYDYHGRDKGFWLDTALKEDRFIPFLPKVKLIQIEKNWGDLNKENQLDPTEYHNAEVWLREVPTQYVLENFSDEDRVLVTDIDEVFDFTDDWRREKIIEELRTDDAIQFERIRYWLDFDMLSFRSKGDIISPSFKVKHLKSGLAKLSDKKWVGRLVENGDRPFAFEYCNCFPIEAHYRKYASSLHTFWVKDKIDDACLTGTWCKTGYQGPPDPNNRWDWFLRVELHENNSPKYVRDNLEQLKTNLVPKDYISNRLQLYGFNGLFEENKDFPKL